MLIHLREPSKREQINENNSTECPENDDDSDSVMVSFLYI